MKHIILIFSFFAIACQVSQKQNENFVTKDPIIYILPNSITQLLQNAIQKSEQKIYFCMYSLPDYFIIYMNKINSNNINPYVTKTNRVLFISGKFYPLISDTDMMFGTTRDSTAILDEFSKGGFITKKTLYTTHEGYFVKFKANGEIIESGIGNSR